MARFYGKRGRYLKRNEIKYWFWAIGVALLPLVLMLMVRAVSKTVSEWYVVFSALLLVLFLTHLGEPLIGLFNRTSLKFRRGWTGEREVAAVLKDLPNEFAVFQDVGLQKARGNIDFVVAGPTGIFTIEVKSHRGHIDYNGYFLTLNGRSFKDRDPLKQAFGEAMSLKQFLKYRINKEIFVKPVIVFSNRYTKVRFGLKAVENVSVIQKEFLLKLLGGSSEYQYPVPQTQIETVLKNTVTV